MARRAIDAKEAVAKRQDVLLQSKERAHSQIVAQYEAVNAERLETIKRLEHRLAQQKESLLAA